MTAATRLFTGRDLKARLLWLVKLRYAAVAGIVAYLVGSRQMGVLLPTTPVLAVAAAVLVHNLAMHPTVRYVNFQRWQVTGHRLALAQIMLDLVALVVLLHLTGGVINPLVFFTVFHALIAAIVLSERAAYGISAWLMAALVGLAGLERLNVWPIPAFTYPMSGDPRFAVVLLTCVAATLFVAVYLASTLIGDVASRDARLQLANARLREQDHLREQTVRRVAHDLKGPLGVVQTSTRVLLDGYAGELGERQRTQLQRVEARAEQLHRLVTRLFAITDARVLARRDRVEVSLLELVERALTLERERIEGKQIGIEVAVSPKIPPLSANHDQLVAMFTALLDNAIGYTPDHGRIRIEARETDDEITVVVADTGVGIAPDELGQVGQLMFRGREARRLVRDGSGLGLALVKAIAAAHGGTLTVESPWREAPREPVGTCVRVTLRRSTNGDASAIPVDDDVDEDDEREGTVA